MVINMNNKIDLHIHTNCSDGLLSPYEIIDEALKVGVNTISITDHDTVDAYTEKLISYAKEKHIKLIPGVEISTKLNKVGYHVLGYNIDINNKNLKDKLKSLKNARHDYLNNVAHKLEELGYILNTKKLSEIEIVTKAHIARDIISNKENESLLLKEFNEIPNMGKFIETIMNEGCPAYVKKESITPTLAAKLIRSAGGIVVLAHPVCYKYEDDVNIEDIKQLILDMQVDGIEAMYIYIDKNHNKINEIKKWCEVAKEFNLLITIGSDFHNFDNIHPTIGLNGEDVGLCKSDYDKLIKKLDRR